MTLLRNAIIGIFGLLIAMGLISDGAFRVLEARKDRKAQFAEKKEKAKQRKNNYNIDASALKKIKLQSITPTLQLYGRVQAKQFSSLKSDIEGEVTFVDRNFKNGGFVEKGTLLVQIDPIDIETKVKDAEVSLLESQSDLKRLKEKYKLLNKELDISQQQLDLYSKSLERQRSMFEKKLTTDNLLEQADLKYISGQQTIVKLQQIMFDNKANQEKTNIAIQRDKINLDVHLRDLEATKISADFSGILSNINDMVIGKKLQRNEKIATLIDPQQLEVSFSLSNPQFARMIDDDGNLLPLPTKVILDLGERDIIVNAKMDRIAPNDDSNLSGRQVFALIDQEQSLLRIKDFVRVDITEQKLDNIALIPTQAIDENNAILIVGDNDILRNFDINILRYIGNDAVVDNLDNNLTYVVQRSPQLGAGIKLNIADKTKKKKGKKNKNRDKKDKNKKGEKANKDG